MKKTAIIFLFIPTLTLASPEEAFNQGVDFGKSEVGDVKGQISTPNATGSIPNYTSTNGASNYYLDGKGSLAVPASGDVTNCTSTSSDADSDAHTHGKCEGVRMLMSDPGKKNVMFPLNKNTDPLVLERNKVKANPDAYLGSLNSSGNYSACVDKTVNEPDTYTEEVCNQFISREDKTCQEILNVEVIKKDNCVPGLYNNPHSEDFCIGCGAGYPFQIGTTVVKSYCAGKLRAYCTYNNSYSGYRTYIEADINIDFNNLKNPNETYAGKCYFVLNHPTLEVYFYYSNLDCKTDNTCTADIKVNLASGFTASNKKTATWKQTLYKVYNGYEIVDRWDDQCGSMKARLQ